MFINWLKVSKFKKMFNERNIVSRSIVLADRRITRLQNNTQISINIESNQIPFEELANIILITNSLRVNDVQESVQQEPGINQLSRQFETTNFSFKLEPLRFGIWQKGNFNNQQLSNIMQTLIDYDTTGNVVSCLGAIGINYEHQLTISDQSRLFSRLLSNNCIFVNNTNLTNGNFKFSYNINTNLLINIEILNKLNQWYISFNADNLITPENTIEMVFNTDFYNTHYLPMARALLT